MGRQKFNKRAHIAKANILHESRDLANKGLLTEQQNPSCPSIYYNGQPGTQNYWQANYITQGQLNFCAFFNAILKEELFSFISDKIKLQVPFNIALICFI